MGCGCIVIVGLGIGRKFILPVELNLISLVADLLYGEVMHNL